MKPIVIKSLGQLVKFRGLRMGDVEKQCGVSAGYFSRLTNYTDMSFKIAKKLSVAIKFSLDDLYDFMCDDEMLGND